MIRLMLVDDHEVVRTGLRSYLDTQDGMRVVAEAGSGKQAIELASQYPLDLILMDITMPEMDGLEATRRLKAQYPQVHVLALTIHEDKQYLFQMLAAGASGYITKQAAADELVDAIRTVASGNVYLQPALARWLLEDYRRLLGRSLPAAPHPSDVAEGRDLEVLSRRERQVLELVAQGMTNPQIGSHLGISPKTVARHRERIMDKLDLHSSTGLVKYAIRTGLVEVD